VKELSENNDEGEYDQEEEYDAGWSKKPVFLEGPEQAWHGLLYFQNMSDVKGLDENPACGRANDGQKDFLSHNGRMSGEGSRTHTPGLRRTFDTNGHYYRATDDAMSIRENGERASRAGELKLPAASCR
jgi:hypothetical protein